jgi:hypothetical protein
VQGREGVEGIRMKIEEKDEGGRMKDEKPKKEGKC